ncbi:HD domain-containing phosphohydrolase [Beduini massiliensis]|uniref:HD domain-containing phosphohydrolase n=1 Tax=Beduini massiliensis TaxID=1585974 RepID=UPI0006933F38|nr:HD domain-containing phosphohydrolase [Beduini massiliensis]
MNIIKDQDVIIILKTMLNRLDDRLVDHGERVAYLCLELMRYMNVSEEEYLHVAKLALLHDIGAYKTEEVDALLSFESEDVWEHAIYGYLFLTKMSPLKKNADCVLYHHMSYERLMETDCSNKKIAALIHLCDRIDVSIKRGASLPSILHQEGQFDPIQVKAFEELNHDNRLIQRLENKSYQDKMNDLYQTIYLGEDERKGYLEMLAYSIDFRSEFTVLHTITTTAIAIELGKQYQLSSEELDKLFYAALLHDIGKGAIPISILEKQGKLNDEETKWMQRHVSITEEILNGYIQTDVLHMAARHHEKLDGSGYPHQLTDKELTLGDRIVAIADILSALLGKRSYKEKFSITKAISIIEEMAENEKIDREIVRVFADHHEDIMIQVEQNTKKMNQLYGDMLEHYQELKTMYWMNSVKV